MSAYIIVKMEVTDMEQYKKYIAATPAVVAEFGGRFIARGGETVTLEGPEEKRRVVLMEFPSLDKIKAFFGSPVYREARKLRESAAVASIVAVDGA
ncbi:MAG: DUF1330 domain-containing protein [Candidatus Eisenbacteria bacterium]